MCVYVCVCVYLRVYMQGGNRARLKGPFDVEEEIDYVFCPGCLEDVPEVEAKLFAYRQNMRVSRRCCACVCACGSKHLRVRILYLKAHECACTNARINIRTLIHTHKSTDAFVCRILRNVQVCQMLPLSNLQLVSIDAPIHHYFPLLTRNVYTMYALAY